MKKVYQVDVDCANCAAKMEAAVKATPVILAPAPEVNPYAAADHTADAKL